MQLSELEPVMSVIHIRGKEYRTKFSLNCLLCLERMYKALPELLEVDYDKWSVEDVLQLTRAALLLQEDCRAFQALCLSVFAEN